MIELVLDKGVEANEYARGCADCLYCRGALSLWCTNDDAVKYRRTHFPGVVGCGFWEPARKATWLERWFSFGSILLRERAYPQIGPENRIEGRGR